MLVLLARAKINWTLDILGKMPNGYHRMDILMSGVELADELTLEKADTLSLTVSGNPRVPAADNLVLKAAEALRNAAQMNLGVRCTLNKRVPIGAGMGGGSADAAAALIGLNQLWQLGFTQERLMEIGAGIGADVPFLLSGGFARVGGIGEEIHPLAPLPYFPLVIVQPCDPLTTRDVFAAYDSSEKPDHPYTNKAQAALLEGKLQLLDCYAGNVLQQAAEAMRPPIGETVAALTACGAAYAAMTGSGSAVFGAFESGQTADEAYRQLHSRWRRCWRTRVSMDGITF